MSKLGTTAFKVSGDHKYEFSIFPLDASFKEGHGGVYVITDRHEDEQHHHGIRVIGVGETEDVSTLLSQLPELEEMKAEGANTICVHPTQDSSARARICKELTEHYIKE